MFNKISGNLKRIWRNWSYFWLCSLLAIAIIVTDLHPLRSQELVDIQQFSQTIAKLEFTWEEDYEGYFDRDFDRNSSSARQIARRLREVKEQTKINPAVIWAVPENDFLQLMLITPGDRFVAKRIPGANRERLSQRITELETAIADRYSLDYLPPARLIYSWLFQPLDPYLAAEQIDTVLLCTGHTLRSLPFSVLHDGEKFAVEKYNIARIPAFSLTDTSYEPKSNHKVLATGASEFTDLPALPGVEVELNTIVPKLWSGKKMLNQDFTVQNITQAHQSEGFDIVHVASHSEFLPGTPENSYIQFSDRKLGLDRLIGLQLDLPQVDLLVLSSCETALGNEDAEFGFAGLAMQAGVKSALASLWTISDAGTVVLMSEFYQQLKSTPIKSEALRNAQLSMLRQQVYVEGNEVRGSEVKVDLAPHINEAELQNFDHPFYWAGFTIIGNPW